MAREVPDALLDIGAHVATGGAQVAYLQIPAATLRGFADGLFPMFAKDSVADAVSGAGHRFIAGHDLLVDVMPRLATNPTGALHQAGHILLTDFPTKAGIPIPGFSHSGLGEFLVDCGIPKGWMCMNVMDAGVGILAIGEGYSDLMAALSGDLPMNMWTFFDTYAQGGVELAAAIHLQNPLLLGASIEDLTAGIVSTWNTCTYHVAMDKFFGYSLTGALVGLGLACLMGWTKGEVPKYALAGVSRGAILGGLSAVSKYFSLGAAVGILAFQIGKHMAMHKQQSHFLSPGSLDVLLQDMNAIPILRDTAESQLALALDYFAEKSPVWREEQERISAVQTQKSDILEEEIARIEDFLEPQPTIFDTTEAKSTMPRITE